MTKPETEWVLVPREPTTDMNLAFPAAMRTGQISVVWKAMIAAAPSAPSTPDAGVVKEWEAGVPIEASASVEDEIDWFSKIGGRMAGALTTQAKRIEGLTAERNHQHFCRICAEDDVKRLEAALETARGALEKCRRWSTVHVVANMKAIHAEATAALPLPALPKTKGEGT